MLLPPADNTQRAKRKPFQLALEHSHVCLMVPSPKPNRQQPCGVTQGMQRNPGYPSIEGELEKAICKAGGISEANAESFTKVREQLLMLMLLYKQYARLSRMSPHCVSAKHA